MGQEIGKVTATDNDIGGNAVTLYSMQPVGGSESCKEFLIDLIVHRKIFLKLI